VLATTSIDLSRRLERLGVQFTTRAVEEHEIAMGDPLNSVRGMALRQATDASRSREDEVIVAVATRIVAGGATFTAPRTEEQAAGFLSALSGRTHEVLSAVAVVWSGGARLATTTTAVTLCELSAEQI